MKTVTLGEACEIVSGATPKSGVPEYWGGPIAWATPADLSSLDSAYIGKTSRTLTAAGLTSCSSQVLPPGSVLLSSRAPIGHVAINTVPMATNQGFKSLIARPDILDARYLFHWLRYKKAYLQSLGNGSTFKELSKSTVERIEIVVPQPKEQRRIAAILDQAAALQAQRQRSRALVDELLPSIFLSMFGDPDQAIRAGKTRALSEVVVDLQGGKSLVAADSGLVTRNRILKISAVTSGRFREGESKPLPDDYTPPADHFVRRGDLLISRANTADLVGAVALVETDPVGVVLPDKLWRFVWREPDRVKPLYVRTLLQMPAMRRELSARSSGTGGSMKNIAKAKLWSMPLPWPDPDSQAEFAHRVRAVGQLRENANPATVDAAAAALQARAFSGQL